MIYGSEEWNKKEAEFVDKVKSDLPAISLQVTALTERFKGNDLWGSPDSVMYKLFDQDYFSDPVNSFVLKTMYEELGTLPLEVDNLLYDLFIAAFKKAGRQDVVERLTEIKREGL